jgi:hypothetical protein
MSVSPGGFSLYIFYERDFRIASAPGNRKTLVICAKEWNVANMGLSISESWLSIELSQVKGHISAAVFTVREFWKSSLSA